MSSKSVNAIVGLLFLFTIGTAAITLMTPDILIGQFPAVQAVENTGESSTSAVETLLITVDILIGSVLTIFLGWIYLRQNSILTSQSSILKAAHRPLIQVASEPEPIKHHPLKEQLPETVPTDGEWVKVGLKNVGNDVATDLQLQCLVAVDGQHTTEYLRADNQLRSVEGSPQTSAGASSIPADGSDHYFFADTEVIERYPPTGAYQRLKYALNSRLGRKSHLSDMQTPLGSLLYDLLDDNDNGDEANHDEVSSVAFGFVVTYETTIKSSSDKEREELYIEPGKRLDGDNALSGPSLKEAWAEGELHWIERLRKATE